MHSLEPLEIQPCLPGGLKEAFVVNNTQVAAMNSVMIPISEGFFCTLSSTYRLT